jgi:hypothetical protein
MEILEMINLFFAGILTGLEVAAHYGFRQPASLLDGKSQIILRQALVRKFRWLVPLFFMPTAITVIILAVSSTNSIILILRFIALATLGIWIYIRVFGTVKINSASLAWSPDSPPDNWREQIQKAEQFHITGTWLTAIVWVCLLISASNIFKQ